MPIKIQKSTAEAFNNSTLKDERSTACDMHLCWTQDYVSDKELHVCWKVDTENFAYYFRIKINLI